MCHLFPTHSAFQKSCVLFNALESFPKTSELWAAYDGASSGGQDIVSEVLRAFGFALHRELVSNREVAHSEWTFPA